MTVFEKTVDNVLTSIWLPEEIKQLIVQEMHYERQKKLSNPEESYIAYQAGNGEQLLTAATEVWANINWLFSWDCTRDERLFMEASSAMERRILFKMPDDIPIRVILEAGSVLKEEVTWNNYIQEES